MCPGGTANSCNVLCVVGKSVGLELNSSDVALGHPQNKAAKVSQRGSC